MRKMTFCINSVKILEVSLNMEKKKIESKNVINKEISEIILNSNIENLSYNLIENVLRDFLNTDSNLDDILSDIETKGFITAREPNLRIHVE